MTAKELIKALEQLIEENDGEDVTVLLASQPTYPMLYTIDGLNCINEDRENAMNTLDMLYKDANTKEMTDGERDLFEERVKEMQNIAETAKATIFICEGSWYGYGNSRHWGD